MHRALVLALAGMALILEPRVASAQDTTTTIPGRVTVGLDAGGRVFTKSVDSVDLGKFEEYKHVPSGLVFQGFRADWRPTAAGPDFWMTGRQLAERDKSFWLGARKPGQFTAMAFWDRIPHTFSTTGQSAGTEAPIGRHKLPDPRPDTSTWNSSPLLSPIRTMWDPVKFVVGATPSEHWNLRAEYLWLDKSGERPVGMSFGSPGTNHREVTEPIDQTVHDLRVSPSYATRQYQLSFSYAYSRLVNNYASVSADNPLQTVDTRTAGAATGRDALTPGNFAHTAMLAGGVNLPSRTRLTGTVTMSWRGQDEPFIPMTSNSVLADSVETVTLPTSLQGDTRTTMVNLRATSRPTTPLTLSGLYRHFDFSDETPEITFPVRVVNDRTFSRTEETRHTLPYSRDQADVSAAWRFGPLAKLTAGYGWERWERAEIRNVDETNEHSPRLALDVTAKDWLHFRGTWSTGWRRGTEYEEEQEVQNPKMRRFDQADRDRERFDLLADITPTGQLGFTLLGGVGTIDYPESEYGLQYERTAVVGGSADWSPSPRFGLGVSYTYEAFTATQTDQTRDPTQLDNPTYVWASDHSDFINTLGGYLDAVLIPGRLAAGGRVDWTRAEFTVVTVNPNGTPTGGTAGQNDGATAKPWPQFTHEWVPASLFVRYSVTTQVAVTVQYSIDRFEGEDFRTDGLQPATGTDIYLGNDYRNYNAQWLTITLSYHLPLIGTGRPPL
jgi:MtrB/PioB family decaheme-associated outer membrane protein